MYKRQALDLTPLDFTQEQLYTLTDESKERVKDIDKDVNIYFIGYTDEDSTVDLAKQYGKANERINVEAIEDVSTRPDLSHTYGIESGSEGIIVECGERSKVLTASDVVTYDTSTSVSYTHLRANFKGHTIFYQKQIGHALICF